MAAYKILYIEDEIFLAKIVTETLERKGYKIKHLTNGSRLFEEIYDFKPDICVFDIMLPYKNGYELAEEVRKFHKELPILFISAKSQTDDLLEGFRVGGNDYIKKPFSMEELIVRMENLIQLTKGTQQQKKQSDEIKLGSHSVFYPIKQLLRIKTKDIQLSYKESQILELLCLNINGATERKTILMKVWSDDSYFNSRNLDVYIRKIRSYLTTDSNIKILTLKGVGYHFVIEN